MTTRYIRYFSGNLEKNPFLVKQECGSTPEIDEKTKIDCAEVFFEQIRKDGYCVRFEKQLKNKKMMEIIDNVLNN